MMKLFGMVLIVSTTFSLWAADNVALKKVEGGYVLDYSIPQWATSQVTTLGTAVDQGYNGEIYTQLNVPQYGSHVTEEVGKPEIPLLSFLMVIPGKDQAPAFEVSDLVEQEVPVSSHVYPAQEPLPKSSDITDRPFSIDRGYYETHGLKSTFVQVVDMFTVRDVPCARINVIPFSYDPLDKTLKVITKAKITIKTAITANAPIDSKSFEDMLRSLTVNYNDYYAPNPENKVDSYLIVTADKYEGGLAEFKKFREKSFTVKMVKYSEAGGSNTKVVEYIKKEKPTYALLVGKHADIPGFKVGSPTDRPYSSGSTSSSTPDVHVGRFNAASETELQNLIKKTMFMEENLTKNSLKKYAMFIGGVDKSNGKIAEGTHNYCIDNYLKDNGWDCKKLYYNSDKTIKKADLINAVNAGPIYCYYSAHGGVTSWSVGGSCGSITATDVNAFTNTAAYPFTGAFACLSGNYQSNSVSAYWTQVEKAAVTNISSSVTSTWGPDDKFQRKMFDAMYKDKVIRQGAVFNAGAIGSASKAYLNQYNLFGDPGILCVPGVLPTGRAQDNLRIANSMNLSILSVQGKFVTLAIPSTGTYTLSLYTLTGQRVQSAVKTFAKSGIQTVPLYDKKLAHGIYLLNLNNGVRKTVGKIAVK